MSNAYKLSCFNKLYSKEPFLCNIKASFLVFCVFLWLIGYYDRIPTPRT